jgi:hypothetical protein
LRSFIMVGKNLTEKRRGLMIKERENIYEDEGVE